MEAGWKPPLSRAVLCVCSAFCLSPCLLVCRTQPGNQEFIQYRIIMDDEPITEVPHNPPACQWSAAKVISTLSKEPLGVELATKVAKALAVKGSFHHTHRDYCGHGLCRTEDGRYAIGAFSDGEEFSEILSFDDEASFIAWLSKQTDYSLAGADPNEPCLHTASSYELNNQRLSRHRLESFAESESEVEGK